MCRGDVRSETRPLSFACDDSCLRSVPSRPQRWVKGSALVRAHVCHAHPCMSPFLTEIMSHRGKHIRVKRESRLSSKVRGHGSAGQNKAARSWTVSRGQLLTPGIYATIIIRITIIRIIIITLIRVRVIDSALIDSALIYVVIKHSALQQSVFEDTGKGLLVRGWQKVKSLN